VSGDALFGGGRWMGLIMEVDNLAWRASGGGGGMAI